jgi:hypothetical protein
LASLIKTDISRAPEPRVLLAEALLARGKHAQMLQAIKYAN